MKSDLIEKHQKMLEEVQEGLSKPQKTLPSKYFYDERGSVLFDRITELQEYYPTRTERRIISDNVIEIGKYLGQKVSLIEPGSGSSEKTRILLEKLPNISSYVPIDISGDYLFKVAEGLQQEYPSIKIIPIQADYTHTFDWPEPSPNARNVVFFPGSTIGNFKMETIQRFLDVIANIAGQHGAALIGVDLKKDRAVLEAAYNDSEGVTAEFNKNILLHINSETGTHFDPAKFRHKAVWNDDKGRIEMHLLALENHTVQLNGSTIFFKKGESIHTENSHKYSLQEFKDMVSPWFKVKKVWTDEKEYFSLQYLEPAVS